MQRPSSFTPSPFNAQEKSDERKKGHDKRIALKKRYVSASDYPDTLDGSNAETADPPHALRLLTKVSSCKQLGIVRRRIARVLFEFIVEVRQVVETGFVTDLRYLPLF